MKKLSAAIAATFIIITFTSANANEDYEDQNEERQNRNEDIQDIVEADRIADREERIRELTVGKERKDYNYYHEKRERENE